MVDRLAIGHCMHFGDASLDAYGAVAYIRCEYVDRSVTY